MIDDSKEKPQRKEDVVRKHEPEKEGVKLTEDTSKKIISNSL